MSKKVRLLRVGMTYPRDIEPGVGQHMYYHSLYSSYQEMIITSKRNGRIIKRVPDVPIYEIPISNPSLGKYDASIISRVAAYVRKIRSQLKFKNDAKKYINEFKPDIVHIYSPIPIITALYAKNKVGSKIVMSLHGSDILRFSRDSFLKPLLNIPDAIVTVSDNIDNLLPCETKKTITYIGNGVDLAQFKDLRYIRKKQFIHVANLRWQKGQKFMIEGFASFYKTHPEYKLIIIGEGEERSQLEELCAHLGVESAVVFKGVRSREYIVEELNYSSAFVLTSVSEGFPKVVIEAMATGTPVISSDVGNIKKIVGDSGIIIPKENSLAVSSAMNEIIQNSDEWIEKKQRAEKIAEEYSWEEHYKKLNAVYEEVLRR